MSIVKSLIVLLLLLIGLLFIHHVACIREAPNIDTKREEQMLHLALEIAPKRAEKNLFSIKYNNS